MVQIRVLGHFIIGLWKKLNDEGVGAPLGEYALLLALIALVAVTALFFMGTSASTGIIRVANKLNNLS